MLYCGCRRISDFNGCKIKADHHKAKKADNVRWQLDSENKSGITLPHSTVSKLQSPEQSQTKAPFLSPTHTYCIRVPLQSNAKCDFIKSN